MAQIDNIVQVFISRQTAQVSIESFDIPLLLVEMTDADTEFTDRVRTYTSLQGVADDLGVNHAGYRMAQSLLGGDIRPTTFKIGKVNKQVGSVESYSQALQEVMDFDNTWYAAFTQSHVDSDIMDMSRTIQAMRKIYLTSTSSQLAYTQTQSVVYTSTVQFDLDGVAEDDVISVVIAGERYQSILDDEGEWSAFTYVGTGSGTFGGTFTLDDLTGLLTITNPSVAFTVTSARQVFSEVTIPVPAVDISATDPVGMDIGQRLKFMGMDRTVVMFSNTADSEWPELAWAGTQLPEVPGSNTWEYKALAGTTVSNLTDSQISILESRGYNYYINVKGVNITRRGKVAEGEWLDSVILVDWLYARIQEAIFNRLVNSKKIPFTNVGATIIENEIRGVLAQAVTNGGIDTYTVQSPLVLNIPQTQRAARVMGDFTFQARLAGAVSIVVVRGTVEY